MAETLSDGAELRDMVEAAWGLIANAGGSDWSKESDVWQQAASRWRDEYFRKFPTGQLVKATWE